MPFNVSFKRVLLKVAIASPLFLVTFFIASPFLPKNYDITIHGLGWAVFFVALFLAGMVLSIFEDVIERIFRVNGFIYLGSVAGEFIKEWAQWQTYTVAIVLSALIVPQLIFVSSLVETVAFGALFGAIWGLSEAIIFQFALAPRATN
jgi:hypothetical protein